MLTYIIAWATSAGDLVKVVNAEIKDGAQPFGNPFTADNAAENVDGKLVGYAHTMFYQAMTKFTEPTIDDDQPL